MKEKDKKEGDPMNNTAAFTVPKSDKTYIKTEYCKNRDSVATEFQCDDLFEVEQLNLEFQKACLALSYFSCIKLLALTCKAITCHIKKRLSMIFGQSA